MTNFINNDTVNNITYMNYFDALTNGELSGAATYNNTQLQNACNTRWGATKTVISGNYLYCMPTAPNKEMKTYTVSSSNYRFYIISLSANNYSTTASIGSINSNNTETSTNNYVAVNSNINHTGGLANVYQYAIITDYNISCSGFSSNGNSLNTSIWRFLSAGWLFDTPFSGGSLTRSLYQLALTNNGVSVSFRPSAENTTTAQTILTSGNAQYSITCASNTGDGNTPSSDLWCTDLWLRDSPSGYAVGRIPHVLLAKGASFTLGNLYYNNTVIDGITDQKIWLCCANYGADKLLMRVWTEGIS